MFGDAQYKTQVYKTTVGYEIEHHATLLSLRP